MTQLIRNRRYKIRLRYRLQQRYGGICNYCKGVKCKNRDLEFAHLKTTDLHGNSRGSWSRLFDVLHNPDSYTLMGKRCHKEFDVLT